MDLIKSFQPRGTKLFGFIIVRLGLGFWLVKVGVSRHEVGLADELEALCQCRRGVH
jgi:hypothetical protein